MFVQPCRRILCAWKLCVGSIGKKISSSAKMKTIRSEEECNYEEKWKEEQRSKDKKKLSFHISSCSTQCRLSFVDPRIDLQLQRSIRREDSVIPRLPVTGEGDAPTRNRSVVKASIAQKVNRITGSLVMLVLHALSLAHSRDLQG